MSNGELNGLTHYFFLLMTITGKNPMITLHKKLFLFCNRIFFRMARASLTNSNATFQAVFFSSENIRTKYSYRR